MTLKEIAKIANVSPAAVSLVLNNKSGVGDAKRQEILTILKENNYVPTKRSSQAVKNLIFLKYAKNGILVEENAGFVSSIIDSLETECRRQGYHLGIVVSLQDLEGSLSSIDYSSVDGVFVLGTELDETAYPVLQKIPCPYVVIDNDMQTFPCNTVTMSNQEMVHIAVTHLASLGFTSIGYMHSKMYSQNFEERSYGFRQIVTKLGLFFQPEHEYLLEPTMLGSYTGMKQYLEANHKIPPCFFADNDVIALGAIKALKEFNYKIPQDISIIGFDDIRFSAISSPSLSTMRVHKSRMGSAAVKLLHESLVNSECHNVKIYINGEIILRHSTMQPSVP